MDKFTTNLKTLVQIYGLDSAMEVIDVMLTQEIETMKELNNCLADEISYAVDSAE